MSMGAPTSPDLILLKGKILTMGRKVQEVQAVAIKGDRITAVGSTEDIKALKGAKTKIVDLRGKVVVPGFIDSHTHLVRRGLDLLHLDLTEAKSLKSLLEAVKKRSKASPQGTWIIGYGWDESRWTEPRQPTRDDLDAAAPNHPVLLRRVDGHLCVVNTMAMGSLNVPLNAPGVHVDETGKRSGVLTEQASEDAHGSLPFHPDEALKGFAQAAEEALQLGVTSVHQTSDATDIQVLRAAHRHDLSTPRVYLKILPALLEPAASLGVTGGMGDEWLRYGGVKVFSDGSLGARTAAISQEYADQPGNRGLLVEEPSHLADIVEKAHAAGFQLALHCIGDRAVQVCLDAIEGAVKKQPRKDHRHRLEHFELANDEQIARAAKLGCIASVQPNFIGQWGLPGQMYEARLGKDGARALNRFAAMKAAGLRLAFGSDHMPMGPLQGIHWAVNAPNKEQRLEPEDALRAYTIDAAYASFEENLKGTIEPGKLADLAVLSGDPRTKPKEISKIRVDMTILGGEVVWKKN